MINYRRRERAISFKTVSGLTDTKIFCRVWIIMRTLLSHRIIMSANAGSNAWVAAADQPEYFGHFFFIFFFHIIFQSVWLFFCFRLIWKVLFLYYLFSVLPSPLFLLTNEKLWKNKTQKRKSRAESVNPLTRNYFFYFIVFHFGWQTGVLIY